MSASPQPFVSPPGWDAAVRPPARRVEAVSRFTDSAGPDLLADLPHPTGTASFVSEASGLAGWGTFARFTATGPDAAARISRWWASMVDRLRVTDDVRLPGSGPIAFVSLGFSPADESVAVIPRTVLGCRDGRRFRTTIGPVESAPGHLLPVTSPGRIRYSDATLPVPRYIAAVRAALDRIGSGELDKVVLAHDLRATAERPIDERYLLARLAAAYPTCWTFAVDGLIGASPEMLLRRHGRRVSSRVLAGSAWPEHAGEHTAGTVASSLLASRKDLAEHAFAVDSVTSALRTVTDDIRVPPTPHALPLSNLTHLATDITARLPAHTPRTADSPASALGLAARLHPSAAVGGSPTGPALALIAELEAGPRGRYAAPVGWMDGVGNGEFALALRCAEVSGRSARLMAGCGVIAGSDPDTEAREAQIKMIPVRDALES